MHFKATIQLNKHIILIPSLSLPLQMFYIEELRKVMPSQFNNFRLDKLFFQRMCHLYVASLELHRIITSTSGILRLCRGLMVSNCILSSYR